ncbi:MAG: hypothetical protein JW913_09750 [Chitinispirillaceae bacterium]|nr:hypothetical protein [Chitinispirillaceae bacterium]
MTEKAVTFFLCVFLLAAHSRAQTMVVDMDTASGIQSAISTQDTAKTTLIVPLRITGADNLFSYQFKVAFDTSRFSFVGAQEDFGMLGEKNILAKNGGALIGIYQLQANPRALDTVEFSCTIQGEDAAKSVSGDGLIGVLYLQSKMRSEDSAQITISQGLTVRFDGAPEPVSSYTPGTYSISFVGVRPPAGAPSFRQREVIVNYQTSRAYFSVPHSGFPSSQAMSIFIHSLNGRLIAERRITLDGAGDHRISIAAPGIETPSGAFVCTLRLGSVRLSKTIGVP